MRFIIKILIGLVISLNPPLSKAQVVSFSGPTTVNVGQQVTYTVSVTNYPNPILMWEVTGGVISTDLSSCYPLGNGQGSSTGTTSCNNVSITWNGNVINGKIKVLSSGGWGGTLNVTVIQPLVVGLLSPATKIIAHNTSAGSLSPSTVSGGSGTYNFYWEKSDNGYTWATVGSPSSTAPYVYVTPALKQDAFYRCKVTSAHLTGYSNVMKLAVRSPLLPGEITTSQILTVNAQPSRLKGSSASGEDGKFTYQWQLSANGTTWQDISGAWSPDYLPPPVTSPVYFRRKVTSTFTSLSQTNIAYSNAILINIQNNIAANIPAVITRQYNQPLSVPGNLSGMQNTSFNVNTAFNVSKEGIFSATDVITSPGADVQTNIIYQDGLGRPVQEIAKQSTPLAKDIIQQSGYDQYGRSPQVYLPFTDGNGTGSFRTDAGTLQNNYFKAKYADQNFFYSSVVHESTADGNIIGSYLPGDSYSGQKLNSGRSTFRTYDAAERVFYWTIENDKPVLYGDLAKRYYGTGDLIVLESMDLTGLKKIQYQDLNGRLILEKTQNVNFPGTLSGDQLYLISNDWLVTYYIYDDFDRLRFVIPPLAVKSFYDGIPPFTISGTYTRDEVVEKLCIKNIYRADGKLIERKNPETGSIYYVYDKAGRVVLTQDSLRRSRGQWLFERFDALNRKIINGLYNSAQSRATLQTAADLSNDYPAMDVSAVPLSFLYYDDYTFADAAGKPFNNIHINKTGTGTNAVTPAMSLNTIGKLTGSKHKVLKPAGTTLGSDWLVEVLYYDDRGRVLQSIKDNINGGINSVSSRYNFSGQPLSIHSSFTNPNEKTGHQTTEITVRYLYDHAGRDLETYQKINNETIEKLIVKNNFDEAGNLIKTILGNNIESLEYNYDLQNRVTGINANYVSNKNAGHYFGTTTGYEAGFSSQLPDGKVSGVSWRTKGIQDTAMAFGYSYDNTARLIKSWFSKNTGTGSWTQANENFSVDTLAYDANGNLKALKVNASFLGTTKAIDNLNLEYHSNSNRLKQVTDQGGNNQQSDFRDSVLASGIDYLYDVNGNLTSDLNKGIAVTYNAIDKPEIITFSRFPTRYIRFVYDATGARLAKIFHNGSRAITISYNAALQFQNDTLQFFFHQEGRVRRNYKNQLVYDYFIQDQNSNVRMVLTEEKDTASYVATFEQDRDLTEPAIFGAQRNSTRENIPVTAPFYNATTNKVYSRLNGLDANKRVGPSVILKVMAGDTLAMSVKGYYKNNELVAGGNTSSQILQSIISAFLGSVTSLVDNGKGNLITGNNAILNQTDILAFINGVQSNNTGNEVPKAYLNYILLDENFNKVTTGFKRVVTPDNQTAYSMNLVVPKNGYLYVYTNNESPMNVYFDDLSVQHLTGPLIQENSLYPTGLPIPSLSSYAALRTINDYLYQGKSFESENDLEWYYFDARYYDPQLARWHNTDPSGQFHSPYLAMGNLFTSGGDPDGRWFLVDDILAAGLGGIINLAAQLISGNVTGIGSALGYFASGALAGEAGLYGGPLAAGAVLGLGNSLTNHFANGGSFSNLDFGTLALSSAVGAATGHLSGALSAKITPYVSKALGNIASPVLKRGLIGAVSGLGTGAIMGGVLTPITGGNFLKNVVNGGVSGLATGGIAGTVSGIRYSREKGLDPWTGKAITPQAVDVNKPLKIQGITLKRNVGEGEEVMQLAGTDQALSKKSVDNFKVTNKTQQDIINFMTDNRLGVQVSNQVTANGTVTIYTTKHLIITSYVSSSPGNPSTISFRSVADGITFLKLRF